MSESLGRAVLELVADLNPLRRDLEAGKASAEEMATTTGRSFKSGITRAALPAAAAVGVLAIGLHKSLDAAEENQAAEAKLAAAFKQTGENLDNYKGRIDAAEASSASLGFKSEDVKASLAQLVVATHDGGQALQMLSVAQDVARYKNISLTDASKLLTTTMAGSARAAHALGIVIPPVTKATDELKSKTAYASSAAYTHAKAVAYLSDKQATARQMVGLLTQKLGGQATAFAKTAAGAKEKMGAEFQLLEINIGNVLIPILTRVSMVLASFSQLMTEHANIAKVVIAIVGTLALTVLAVNAVIKVNNALTAVGNGIKKLYALVTGEQTAATEAQTAATGEATVAQDGLNVALDSNPIGIVVLAIAALVAAIIVVATHFKTFKSVVEDVWSGIKTATHAFINFFTDKVPAAIDTVKSAITNGLGDAKDWVKQHFGAIAGFITDPFTGLLDEAEGAFGLKGKLDSAWDTIKSTAKSAFSTLGSALSSVLKAPVNAIIGLLDGLDFGVHYGGLKVLGHTVIPAVNFDWHPFHIPMLAEGGIVTRPTLAMIGEGRYHEAVIPLDGKHGLGGGGITVNVSGVVGNERDVAVKIGRELQLLKNRGLDFGLA